jgi:glycopeptide antibiotics resistance protein
MPQKCVKDIFNNILLTIPFGFGIHFVARIKLRQVLCLTLLIGCSFEFTQLIMVLMFHVGLRSIDINDIILNTTGAFIGYGLYKLFGVIYYLIIQRFNLQPKHIFAYIGEIMALQHNS